MAAHVAQAPEPSCGAVWCCIVPRPKYFIPCRQVHAPVQRHLGPGDKSGGPKQRHEQHPKLGLKKVLLAVFAICAVSAICAVACCCAPAFKTARIGCDRDGSPLGSLDSAAREVQETLHIHETNAGNDSSFGPVVTLDVTAKSPTPDDPSTQPEGPAPYLLQCDMAVTVPLNLTNAVAAFPQTKSAQLSASGFPAASPVRDFASQLFVAAHCDPAAPRVPEGPAPTADLPSPQQCPALPTLHKALLGFDSFRKHLAVVPYGPEARLSQGVQRQGPALPASPESTKAPSCDQLPWWLRRGGVHANGSPAAYDFSLMPPQPVRTELTNGSTHRDTAAPDLRHGPPAALTLGFPHIAPTDAPIAAKEHDRAWDPQDGTSAEVLAGAAAPGPYRDANTSESVGSPDFSLHIGPTSAVPHISIRTLVVSLATAGALWLVVPFVKAREARLLRLQRQLQYRLNLERSETDRVLRERRQEHESVLSAAQDEAQGAQAVARVIAGQCFFSSVARRAAYATGKRMKALAARLRAPAVEYRRRFMKELRACQQVDTSLTRRAAQLQRGADQLQDTSATLQLTERRLAANEYHSQFLSGVMLDGGKLLAKKADAVERLQRMCAHTEAQTQEAKLILQESEVARAEAEERAAEQEDRQLALRERLHSASAENAALGSKAANLAAKLQHTESLLFQAWAGQGPSSVTGERREG